MRVTGFNVEVYSFVDGTKRQVAVYKVPKTRNAFRKLTQSFELIAKTFQNFVAFVVVPIIDEEVAKDGQREFAAAPVSDQESVRLELGQDVQAPEAVATTATSEASDGVLAGAV
jgi:hypothetical protein